MNDFVKTKIVATIGPASETKEKISSLIKSGARIFRINTSHGDAEGHAKRIATIRQLGKEMNLNLSVLVDLQGPKIRVGNLKESVELVEGKDVVLRPGMEPVDDKTIPVDYAGIVNDVEAGSKLLLDDGKLELRVVSKTKDTVKAKVIHGGLLKKRKGINMPGATASIAAVTERDVKFIKFAVEQDAEYIALSFVREKEDILIAKRHCKKFGGNIPIIAKIEKPQAVDNLKSILSASDGVMVARGDLGIEISSEKVPVVQKEIIREANAQRKAVIVATQMLESMIDNPIPTRAEASDVANAILDNTDAIMLSGETAAGKFPVEAVSMMSMISQNVESSDVLRQNSYLADAKEIYDLDSQAICHAIIRMLDEVEIDAIVAFTKSGYTARLLSKARPSVPLIALSDDAKVCNRLNMFWGIFPRKFKCDKVVMDEAFLQSVDDLLMKETFIKAGDKVLISGAIPYMCSGKTNFIRLHQVGSVKTMVSKK